MLNDEKTLKLIDQLIACWSDWATHGDYYLEVLAPSIVDSDDPPNATPKEKKIIRMLRSRMSPDDRQRLPRIIRWRRSQIESALDRVQKEQERIQYIRQERIRQLEKEREQARRAEEERIRQLEKEKEQARRAEEQYKYQREQERKQWDDLVVELEGVFERDFLASDNWFREQITNATRRRQRDYKRLKAKFVQDWALRELDEELDPEQADSVAATTGNVLVTARAGSGKTRTLVTRAIFLQKHCGVSPRELLLLAFNRTAANEMRDRLAAALGDDLPHVMTFHALAYALVKPGEKLLFDNEDADQLGLSRKVEAVTEAHIKSDKYNKPIRDLMLAYFREDLQRIVDGKLLPIEGFVEYRRSLPRESLNGDRVESFLEKLVANTLFEHDLPYRFKASFHRNGANYRPDFKLNQPTKVVIECFGNTGEDDYDDRADAKRRFWKGMKSRDWAFLEVSLSDIRFGEEVFVAQLLHKLKQTGVPCRKLSQQEIWERIRKRAVGQFTEAMRNFIGRCRQKGLSQSDLQHMVDQHQSHLNFEKAFLEVGISVYSEYLNPADR